MHDSTVRNPDKHDDRQVMATAVAAFLLAAGCITLLLPGTTLDKTSSSVILFPLYLAGTVSKGVRLSEGWKLLDHTWWTGGLVLYLSTAAVAVALLQQRRVRAVLVGGTKTAKLLLCALLSFAALSPLDFLTSKAGMYLYGDQVRYLVLATFAVLFAVKGTAKWWRNLIAVVLGCIVLQSVSAIAMYAEGVDVFRSPGIGARAGGTFDDPLTYYPIALVGALLLVSLAVDEDQRSVRSAYWVCVAVVGTAVFLSFTRAAAMGLAAGLIWLAWTTRRSRALKALAVGAVLLMIVTLCARATTKSGGFGMDTSALGRMQIWRMSAHIIRDNWLFGVGSSGYQAVQTSYVDSRAEGINYTNLDPLNQVLAMTSSHGGAGVLVFVLFVGAVWSARRSGKRDDYVPWEWSVKQGVIAAGVGLLVAGLVDTPVFSYGRHPGTFVWLCCVGFLLHLELRNHPPAGEWKHVRRVRTVTRAVLALVLLGVGSVVALGALDAHRASATFDTVIRAASIKPSRVSLRAVPRAMTDSVIANEDYSFYMHHGYSPVDMHRALRVNIRAGRVKQGGSTITQQLAKNLFFTNDRTMRRKVADLIMAVRLEHRLKKPEILEMYLNTIDFGLGARGVGPAARTYFGKDASELTDAECALLAGLVSRPPKDTLTPDRARSALALTISRLENVNPGRCASVKDEIAAVGETEWLKRHLNPWPTGAASR